MDKYGKIAGNHGCYPGKKRGFLWSLPSTNSMAVGPSTSIGFFAIFLGKRHACLMFFLSNFHVVVSENRGFPQNIHWTWENDGNLRSARGFRAQFSTRSFCVCWEPIFPGPNGSGCAIGQYSCTFIRSEGASTAEQVLYHIRPYFMGMFPYIGLT